MYRYHVILQCGFLLVRFAANFALKGPNASVGERVGTEGCARGGNYFAAGLGTAVARVVKLKIRIQIFKIF